MPFYAGHLIMKAERQVAHCDLTSLVDDEGDRDHAYAGSDGFYVLGSGSSVRKKSPKIDSCQQTGRSYVGWED